jgi:hypothetical protein
MQLTRDQFEQLQTEYPRARADYSGKGMFLKECVGVTVESLHESKNVVQLLASIIVEDRAFDEDADVDPAAIAELALDLRNSMSSDGMGLDVIIYWRNLTVADE